MRGALVVGLFVCVFTYGSSLEKKPQRRTFLHESSLQEGISIQTRQTLSVQSEDVGRGAGGLTRVNASRPQPVSRHVTSPVDQTPRSGFNRRPMPNRRKPAANPVSPSQDRGTMRPEATRKGGGGAPLSLLAGLAGRSRVLVVSAPSEEDSSYRLMLPLLAPDVYCHLAERHILLLVLFHQEGGAVFVRRVSSLGQVSEEPQDPSLIPRLMSVLKLERGQFSMVLLRRNLQVEERYPYPVPLQAVYEAVDRSPARHLEKLRQRGFLQRCKAAGVEGQMVQRSGVAEKEPEGDKLEVPGQKPTQIGGATTRSSPTKIRSTTNMTCSTITKKTRPTTTKTTSTPTKTTSTPTKTTSTPTLTTSTPTKTTSTPTMTTSTPTKTTSTPNTTTSTPTKTTSTPNTTTSTPTKTTSTPTMTTSTPTKTTSTPNTTTSTTTKTTSTPTMTTSTPNKTRPTPNKTKSTHNKTKSTQNKTKSTPNTTTATPTMATSTATKTRSTPNTTTCTTNKTRSTPTMPTSTPNKTKSTQNKIKSTPNTTTSTPTMTTSTTNKTKSTPNRTRPTPNRTRPTQNKTKSTQNKTRSTPTTPTKTRSTIIKKTRLTSTKKTRPTTTTTKSTPTKTRPWTRIVITTTATSTTTTNTTDCCSQDLTPPNTGEDASAPLNRDIDPPAEGNILSQDTATSLVKATSGGKEVEGHHGDGDTSKTGSRPPGGDDVRRKRPKAEKKRGRPPGRKSGKKGILFLEKHTKGLSGKRVLPTHLALFMASFERRRHLLVITTPSQDNVMFTQQRHQYLENVCEMAVRKMSIITLLGSWSNVTMAIDHYQLDQEPPLKGVPVENLTNQELIKALRKELGMTFNDFYMVLTDVDLKVKQEYEVPIAMQAVFQLIDTFPSCIAEMEDMKKRGMACKKDTSTSLESFLSRFRWRRRLVIISTPDEEEQSYQQQMNSLSTQTCSLGHAGRCICLGTACISLHSNMLLVTRPLKGIRHMSVVKLIGNDVDMGGVLELYPINGSSGVRREALPARLVRDIRGYLQVSPAHFCMLLLGKDGNVKAWWQRPLAAPGAQGALAPLYALVDSTQLRRQEVAVQRAMGMRCLGQGHAHQGLDAYDHHGYGY